MLVDVAVLLRVRVGVREGRTPARALRVRLLGGQQQLRRPGLDAIVSDDQGTETRYGVAPGLATVHPERTARIAIAERKYEPVVAQDPRHRGGRVPVGNAVIDGHGGLVRIPGTSSLVYAAD